MGNIALLCSWGGSFGNGHLQRMASLLQYLNKKGLNPYLVTERKDFPIRDFSTFIEPEITEGTSLIIRDSRDSTSELIRSLRKTAPVVAVDDLGEGRSFADCAVDLLPNLLFPYEQNEKPFIFGHSFSSAIKDLQTAQIMKEIDFCVYAGFGASPEYISFLQSLLPSGSRSVFFDGRTSFESRMGESIPSKLSYPEAVLSSSNLISHFGISLFEGALCGCSTFAINPTDYHSKLSDVAGPVLGTVNFGVYPDLDCDKVKNSLKEAGSIRKRSIVIAEVREGIELGLDLFYERIKPFI